MLGSAIQFFLEFSLLLGACYLLIRKLPMLASEKASLLAGLPILCFLIPSLRVAQAGWSGGMITWVVSKVSIQNADWGLLLRNASLSDVLFLVYWAGFAVFFARFLDRLNSTSLSLKNRSLNRFFRKLYGKDQVAKKALAAMHFLGAPEDTPLFEKASLTHSGPLHRAHFLEVFLLESIVIINWWNPIVHLYRNAYLFETRRSLEELTFPSRAIAGLDVSHSHKAIYRVLSCLGLFVLFINVQSLLPGGEAYVRFLERVEDKSRYTFLAEQETLEPNANLIWGGHKIPIASVKPDDQLTYQVYHMLPFEFYMLQNQDLKLEIAGNHPKMTSLIGHIGVPNSDDLSSIHSKEDFFSRLPRLRSMGEQTFFLRMESAEGKSWVAVLAVSDKAQVYNQGKALRLIASDVAGLEQIESDREAPLTPYRFQWGEIEIPLEKYASPDVYRGYLEVSLDSVVQAVQEELKVYVGDSLLDIEHLTIRAYGDPSWRSVIWYPEVDEDVAVLNGRTAKTELADKLTPGHQVTIYGRAGGLYLNTIAIQISDPNELYSPLFWAPEINREPADYDYQLINRPGYSSLVRMDTLNQESARIHDMYRGKEDYRIVHVDSFKTNERLVNAWESETEFVEEQSDLSVEDLDYAINLPEFHGYQDALVQLKWGAMWAMPNSQVYEPNEYELNRRESVKLWIGDQPYAILKATAAFYNKSDAQGIYFLEEKDFVRPHLLPKAMPETTVFFKQLIIADSTGREFLLPATFAFHIGKEVMPGTWDLHIETDYADHPQFTEGEHSYQFKHYRLSDLVTELLDIRPNKLVFENMKIDPFVRVTFMGEGYRRSQAYQLMLEGLMKKYAFTVKQDRQNGPIRRIQVNYEDKLLEHSYEGSLPEDSEKITVFNPEGYHLLTGITLTELTHLLEDRFGEIVEMYPTPYNNMPFTFSLVLDNYQSVQQQLLDEYGLQVFEGDWSYYVLEVTFGN